MVEGRHASRPSLSLHPLQCGVHLSPCILPQFLLLSRKTRLLLRVAFISKIRPSRPSQGGTRCQNPNKAPDCRKIVLWVMLLWRLFSLLLLPPPLLYLRMMSRMTNLRSQIRHNPPRPHRSNQHPAYRNSSYLETKRVRVIGLKH